MIALAREARGYSQAELADLCGISRPSVSRIEQGDLLMNEEFISKIKNTLNFSDTLYTADAEPLPPAIYRKRETVPAKLMNKVDALINIYALGIGRLLNAVQFKPKSIPSFPVSKDQPLESALVASVMTRKLWKLDGGVVTNLTKLLEDNGFITLPIDFETERIDSRSVLIDDKYPVIFYNKKLLGDRLRFTLAYELGHIVMHTRHPSIRFDDSASANAFAAEFLMPRTEIVKDLDDNLDLDRLAVLKSKWMVSMQALLYRAEDLNVITANQKRYVINRFNQLKIRRREPKELDVPIERGTLLRDLITNYRSKQKMNVSQIAAFLYMKEDEFLSTFS